MRFSLILELEKSVFPLEYRKVILSYIKNALSKCNDGKYYDLFFKDTNQKDYCFTAIMKNPIFKKELIILGKNEIKVKFSTDERNKLGLILFSSFIAQKNKKYPLENENYMTLKKIEVERREEFVNSRAIFKTSIGSGICVREHIKENNKDNYYIYTDSKFNEKLRVVLNNQLLKGGFNKHDIDNVIVNIIDCKKVVAKHYKRYIDLTTGIIEIKANPNILQYVYDVGLGSRRSCGFGQLDLITQDLV